MDVTCGTYNCRHTMLSVGACASELRSNLRRQLNSSGDEETRRSRKIKGRATIKIILKLEYRQPNVLQYVCMQTHAYKYFLIYSLIHDSK